MSYKRIGIFGGTFNPPHLGHLILAETAADSLELDCVFFVPASNPPHKIGMPRAPAEVRLAMVELAIASNPRFTTSRADMDRPGPHYAVDMIAMFHREFPEAELFFLMGSDSLRDFLSWSRPDEILHMTTLVVMQRPDVYPDLSTLTRRLPGLLEKLYFLEAPEIEISSTEIVARIKQGRSIRYRVTESVLNYLTEHQLYIVPKDDES
ncbi:MAG: nicotinate (nicotinamide) nucleotide adenylyltransferase [Chloroflexi bacterium]|nr:nicotinate (nicotinamide) nucleotide adenylyltransferase [Chloroflexota bacterium]